MSEEIKKPTEEPTDQQAAPGTASAPAKKKKINRLTPDELEAKIKDMTEKNLARGKYHKHLMERKQELEAQAQ